MRPVQRVRRIRGQLSSGGRANVCRPKGKKPAMEAEEGSVKTIRNMTENLRGRKMRDPEGSKDLLMLHGTRTWWVEWLQFYDFP